MQGTIQKWVGPAACGLAWVLTGLIVVCDAKAQAAPAGGAVKLGLVVNTRNEASGTTADIVVSLLDPQNRAVNARTDVSVEVQPSPGSDNQKQQLVIRAGTSSASGNLTLREPGLIQFQASARGLRPAMAVAKVGGAIATPGGSGRDRGHRPEPSRSETRVGSEAGRVGATAGEIGTAGSEIAGAAKKFGEIFGSFKSGQTVAVLAGATGQRYLADGNDGAIIRVFLSEPAKKKLEIKLATSGGQLEPPVVIVEQNAESGEAKLTSKQQGTFTVRIGSVPKGVTNATTELAFKFGPAIVGLGARSVPKISLFETAQIRVELQDAQQRPLNTDEARTVSLALLEGRAQLGSSSQTFQPNSFEAKFEVQPTAVGRVKLEARVDQMPGAICELQVTWPMLLLACSGLGGALGGLLAVFGHTLPPALRQIPWYRRFRYVPLWRMSVGLVTGFVFYWALLFLPFSLVPRGVLLNPFSSAVCSMLGGWVGLEVFSLVLKVIKPGGGLNLDSDRPAPRRKPEPATS